MSKVSGAYPSLSRGVNQQPFEARLDGQHGEQVNMWSDPVHGLSRRRGTVYQGGVVSNPNGPALDQLSPEAQKEVTDFYASYQTVPYTTNGLELLVHFPTRPAPLPVRLGWTTQQHGIRVTNKLKTEYLSDAAVADELAWTHDTVTVAAINKGIAAACQVGRYMLFYPNGQSFAVGASYDAWGDNNNRSVAFTIRQGVPNRTYRVGATLDGVAWAWEYTTPSSAYSGTLDTSDIAYSDPEYTKKINDRVNAYNSAVTAWITTAASRTRPSYIVASLLSQMSPQVAAIGGFQVGSPSGSAFGIGLSNTRGVGWTITDSANNESVSVTELTVTTASELPTFHQPGKIVQVKADRGGGSYYVRAVALSQWGAFTEVRWEECPRTATPPIANPFLIMAVKNPKTGYSRVAITGSVALLRAILDDPTVDMPPVNSRLVGDDESSPHPALFNKPIDWMGMFQDRLVMVAGGVVNMSEVGNYFNFYRTATLTVPDNDPVELFALGAEADVIHHGVLFDRSLLLFGENQQYTIDGRNPVTPASTVVIQSSAIEDAVDCPPVAGGSLVFFGKRREGSTEVFQIEVGDVADTSSFTGLGLQLADYLPGSPTQILYVASPSMLIVRTTGAPYSLFVFRFIDQGRQRIMDSWSRFDYGKHFGVIYAAFYHQGALFLRAQRDFLADTSGTRWGRDGGGLGVDVIERQSLLSNAGNLPHMDSMRVAYRSQVGGDAVDFRNKAVPFLATVLAKTGELYGAPYRDTTNPYGLAGTQPCPPTAVDMRSAFADLPELSVGHEVFAVTGMPFASYVELTSPVQRDQGGQPIMQGRLTVSKLDVYYKDTGGLLATVSTEAGSKTALSYNARSVGALANRTDTTPAVSGTQPVFIGRSNKEYTCRISAQTWLPLTLTRVTWTGQWFMNHRFV